MPIPAQTKLNEQRSVRMSSGFLFARGPGDGVLQRPGRFVNAPVGLAPAPNRPGGGRPDQKPHARPAREPFRLPRQSQPAALRITKRRGDAFSEVNMLKQRLPAPAKVP